MDLNLLVDYAWPHFLHTADAFVSAVPSASDLVDLLLALQPGSMLAAGGGCASLADMLGWQERTQLNKAAASGAASTGGQAAAGAAAGGAGGDGKKVSLVCEAVRAAVLRLPGRFVPLGHLKTVVMSYAR